MASARLKEGILALGVAAILLAAVYFSGAPSWMGWLAAGFAVLLAEVVGRWRWRGGRPE